MKNTKLQELVRGIQAEIPNNTKVPTPPMSVVQMVGNNPKSSKGNSKSLKSSENTRQKQI